MTVHGEELEVIEIAIKVLTNLVRPLTALNLASSLSCE